MKIINHILYVLDKVFDFLSSDEMFYIIVIWFVAILIKISI